ncbi:MAG: protease modulator HflC [Sedimentisphaerales bacterium]|nr:protease modulator HflC [Sedimentisphaerales bacterium]
MKKLAITILVAVVIVAIALYFTCFQVRETEFAIVTRFGDPVREIMKPGFYFNWPMPIEQVLKFDARMKVFETETGETTTKGAVPIIVNTYVVWRIQEPLTFFKSVGTTEQAESKLRSQINDTQNKVVGLHEFGEFVNSDPEKIRFEQMQQEMLDDISKPALNNYGIEIVTMGIKQLKVSEDTTENVFERMRVERERKSMALEAQGSAEALRITSKAEAEKTEILAAAEAEAKTIRGRGAAEAAKYLAMLEADPLFGIFLQNLEALEQILKERATIVFSADTEPFNLLKEIPKLEPAEKKE